VALLPIVLLY